MGKNEANVRTVLRRTTTVVSLVLLIAWTAALALWIRSYWVESRLQRSHRHLSGWLHVQRETRIISRWGRVYLVEDVGRTNLRKELGVVRQRLDEDARFGLVNSTAWRSEEVRPPVRWGPRGHFGFAYRASDRSYQSIFGRHQARNAVLVFPWGVVLGVLGIVPIGWLLGVRKEYRRRKRRDAGLCPTCSYDLRATPDRCPECGQRLH